MTLAQRPSVTLGFLGSRYDWAACDDGKVARCPECGRAFRGQKRSTRKSNLKSHMGIHYGWRPFQCHLCRAKFTRKNDLKIHLLRNACRAPSLALARHCFKGRSPPELFQLDAHFGAFEFVPAPFRCSFQTFCFPLSTGGHHFCSRRSRAPAGGPQRGHRSGAVR